MSALLFVAIFMYGEAFGTPFASVRKYGQSFSELNLPYTNLQNLVTVAALPLYTSSKCDKPDVENSSFVEPYQNQSDSQDTFIHDIKAGVEAAAAVTAALLLFSGGETWKDAGPSSEAQSYWSAAESEVWFGKEDVRLRTLTEEFARDTFENLMFSVCRFRGSTGHYPTNITVVSYDFIKLRFTDVHRHALRFPET